MTAIHYWSKATASTRLPGYYIQGTKSFIVLTVHNETKINDILKSKNLKIYIYTFSKKGLDFHCNPLYLKYSNSVF